MRVAHLRPAHHREALARRRGWRERGTVTVEMAMVAMFLLTLIAGTYDYGMAWRAALVTNEAARTAARTGSSLGADPQADWYALSGARAALTNGGRINDVQRVIVYKSATVNGNVPAACLDPTNTSTTEPCTVITGSQFRGMTASSFNSTTGCFTVATVKNWCASSRNEVQLTADYYGIYIEIKATNTFKVIANSVTIARDAVMRIEPQVN